MQQDTSIHARASGIDSAYAWVRLLVTLLIGAIGSVGMWSGVVVLPAIQAEFGVARGDASLPFTVTMVCYGFGGIIIRRPIHPRDKNLEQPPAGRSAAACPNGPLQTPSKGEPSDVA